MISNITIGFSTTNKFMSRVIRWVTRGKVSHAWIAFHDKCLDMNFVMQAETWGYELRPRERWNGENILVAEYAPKKDYNDSVTWMVKKLGVKYDWFSAFFSGTRKWVRRLVKGKLRSPRRLMCAEAVVRFLRHGGSITVSNLDVETTSPVELLRAINTSAEFEKVSHDQ